VTFPEKKKKKQTMSVSKDPSTFGASGIKGSGVNYDKMMANNKLSEQFVASKKKGWFG